MRIRIGKNRKCRQCGGEPVLHVIPALGLRLIGLVCRQCSPQKCKVFPSITAARKYWNRKNKG